MRKVAIIPLMGGLVIGGLAIKLGLNSIQQAKASARVATVNVVVARDEIQATSEIDETMLQLVQTPVTPLLGEDSFTDMSKLIGRVTEKTVPVGAVIREELLAPPGTPAGLMVRIPAGFRAVSVKINEFSGVAYQLRPGNFVDVIAVMQVGRTRETVSRIILQQIEVIAVGRALTESDKDGKGKVAKSVTLLVRNSDVPKLHLAETNGKVTMAMRSPDDNLVADSGKSSESELLGFATPTSEDDEFKAEPVGVTTGVTDGKRNYQVMLVDGGGRPTVMTFDRPNSTQRIDQGGGAMRNAQRSSSSQRGPSAGPRGAAEPPNEDADEEDDGGSAESSPG